MIPAFLNGKLTFRQENMEDLLTSNVFGLLKYVPAECGTFPFLAQARTVEGDCRPFSNLLRESRIGKICVDYIFWPKWPHCEPDVVLAIRGELSYLVAIEAKYWSGKSSKAVMDDAIEDSEDESNEPKELVEEELKEDEDVKIPCDQLAREWTDLVAEASKFNARPVLVYLTTHLHCPKAELLESINDCGSISRPAICWLSWRELPRLFRHSSDPHLVDIVSLAEKMELTFYEGIGEVLPIRADWTFQGPTWQFNVAPIICNWSFKNE